MHASLAYIGVLSVGIYYIFKAGDGRFRMCVSLLELSDIVHVILAVF